MLMKMSVQHGAVGAAILLLTAMSTACGQASRSSPRSGPVDSIAIEGTDIHVAVACFRSPHSVFFGPPTPSGQQGKSPGWLALELSQRGDSGWAKLVDPDSKAFYARWHRAASDTVAFTAADDFLRVEMRLAVSDSLVVGSARAHSDAALERDASGRLGDLRREWTMRAIRSPCANMPEGWTP